MEDSRFDDLTRTLARGLSRRSAVKAAAAGLLGALGHRAAADAQVSQAFCGNVVCGSNPGVCNDGCVCCGYPNGNSRCRPAGKCNGPGFIIPPATTTAAPTTTTTAAPTTTSTTPAPNTTTTTTTSTTAPPDRCADVVCTASDAGHLAGVCDPATGLCSNPVAPDDTACEDDGNDGNANVCIGGTCQHPGIG